MSMSTENPTDTAVSANLGEPATRLYLAVGRLARSLRRTGGSPGLGPGSVSALATLVASDAMRLGDLAGKEGIAPPTLSRMIAALVDSGYVAREPDPADRRASLVTATEKGRAVILEMRSSRMREMQARVGRLAPEHRAALAGALDALEALIEDECE